MSREFGKHRDCGSGYSTCLRGETRGGKREFTIYLGTGIVVVGMPPCVNRKRGVFSRRVMSVSGACDLLGGLFY